MGRGSTSITVKPPRRRGAAPVAGSWWIGAPREDFTMLAERHMARMRLSRY